MRAVPSLVIDHYCLWHVIDNLSPLFFSALGKGVTVDEKRVIFGAYRSILEATSMDLMVAALFAFIEEYAHHNELIVLLSREPYNLLHKCCSSFLSDVPDASPVNAAAEGNFAGFRSSQRGLCGDRRGLLINWTGASLLCLEWLLGSQEADKATQAEMSARLAHEARGASYVSRKCCFQQLAISRHQGLFDYEPSNILQLLFHFCHNSN